MNQAMDEYAVNILQQLGLTEQAVREHVFRPDHLTDAVISSDQPQLRPVLDESGSLGKASLFYRLNTGKLRSDLHDLLGPCTIGYSMQLRQYGKVIFDEQAGLSKMPGDAGLTGQRWTASTPMHVASVSKLFTAMALIRVLQSHHISVDAPIWPYLPAYWIRGDSIDQLTFRNLLLHKTGLVINGPKSASDFQTMKAAIARGVHGFPGYANINYGLMRILISTIDAPELFRLPIFNFEFVDDAYWDTTTIAYYSRYVNEHIFAPVGVNSNFLHTAPNALGYPSPAVPPGFNSGDLSTMSGGVGWHLSVNDLLTVMAAFRRRGIIVDPLTAQSALDNQFGLDVIQPTKLGNIYGKGGWWTDGNSVEQSNVFFLPKGMELAILANSPFCQPGFNFMGNVLDTIDKNIQLNALSLTTTVIGSVALFALINGAAKKVKAKK